MLGLEPAEIKLATKISYRFQALFNFIENATVLRIVAIPLHKLW